MRDDGYGLRFEAALDGTWKSSVDGAPEYPTNWKLLKLHGSTNWLVPYLYVNFETLEYASAVPTSDNVFLYWQSTMPYGTHKNRWKGGYASTCYCYYPPNIPEPLFTQEQLSLQPGHVLAKFVSKGIFAPFNEMDSAGVPASPLLITPVRQKKYNMYETTINSLWSTAADLFSSANKVVVVGYSFPFTDDRACELIATALSARPGEIAIEIVAPDATAIISRIGDGPLSKAKSITLREMKYEEYIHVLAGDAPRLMKKAASEYTEVHEWVKRIYALNNPSRIP